MNTACAMTWRGYKNHPLIPHYTRTSETSLTLVAKLTPTPLYQQRISKTSSINMNITLSIHNILRLYTMTHNYFPQSGAFLKKTLWQARFILSTFSKITSYTRDKICKKCIFQLFWLPKRQMWVLVYRSYFVLNSFERNREKRQIPKQNWGNIV